jgi:ABC-2 type transport system ATP-binding protein
MEFRGQMIGFANALWTNFELVSSKEEEGGVIKARVKLLGSSTVNSLLQAVLPVAEIISLKEVVPSMNDIFISKVKEENLELNSNLTE